jgi:hypothetical protein
LLGMAEASRQAERYKKQQSEQVKPCAMYTNGVKHAYK